ncbi:DUF4297 family anti-phage-associated protein [Flagellimonas pacifica]|uniref:Uncharacterized protein n=1 Tax=Flagellimonas pacifica TaxID=1247520 RepID=A0A285N133_9FLAO|nr:DUF4297 family anti-phage-associated protein [Allomuricauda parva]SNZ01716.1 hypothetical protein SAMN06265377_3558 [Allomuricauda parva]
MTDRSAVDTIVGYFYQFDKTILDILNSYDEQTIVVEGIEDIDLISPDETIAVQCKYYEKSEYNHSVIKKSIMLMFKHYSDLLKSDSPKIKYHLYGHYKSGQEKLLPLSCNYLKTNFLTYTKNESIVVDGEKITKRVTHKLYEELGLSDENLSDFINLLAIDINAPSFDNQLNEIFNKLCEHFSCDKFEAENFYYNSGLKVIKDLSIKQDVGERSITKPSFLSKINTKQLLFNSWFVHYKGKAKYLREVKKNYFNTGLNTNPYERFFLFESKPTDSVQNIKEIVRTIQRRWSKLSRLEKNSFCPYIYIHNIRDAKLQQIKQEFFDEGMLLKDGIDFLGASFRATSLMEQATFQNNIKIKFINSIAELDLLLNQISAPKEIYQFYHNESFYLNQNCTHIIIQIEETLDIKNIV